MSYQHYSRTPSNIASYSSNMSINPTVGQTTAPPPLTIIPSGTTVLAYYQDYAWYFGVIQNYNLTRNGTLIYQILFRSGEIRSVASSQVLNQQSNNQNIEIGSRVVVQHPTKSMFISSLVAELPATENSFRYLLFLDDGSACYKTKDKLWVINLVENPILMLPPAYKSFIQRYFTMSVSSIKMINLNSNDSVTFTNYDNTALQFTGKVAEVDCSIAKIRYSIPNGGLAEEWIHRGSSRILSFGHTQNNYYDHSGSRKMNGSFKQISNQELEDTEDAIDSSDQQKFTKSPLKGKPFMVTPSMDPFMFSEDESSMPSVSKSGKYTTFNSWPVSDNASSRNNTYGFNLLSPKNSTLPVHPPPQSPILILDESPINEPPPYTSPREDCSPFKRVKSLSTSPVINSTQNSNNPVSVFSWSAPEESGTRRRLDMSPKMNLDVEFDFADTILNTAVNSSVPDSPRKIDTEIRPSSVPLNFTSHDKEDIVVIDDDDEVEEMEEEEESNGLDEDNLPPLVIETESKKNVLELDETQVQARDSYKNESSRNVPMILHQEACIDSFPAEDPTDTSHQNGNVIEVVVHSSQNGQAQAFISVTPSVEMVPSVTATNDDSASIKKEHEIESDVSVAVVKDEELNSPVQQTSRKRRKISPLKSPKIAIPKMKINLRALNESAKELAAQKCVKRARKQQSKEISATKDAKSDKKKKMSKATELKMNSLLMAKKDQIKLNPDAKIARWLAPWFAKTSGRRFHSTCDEDNGVVSILKKVELLKTDEELEEGELDDSDGEETAESHLPPDQSIPDKDSHQCSILCNQFNFVSSTNVSPLSHPLMCGWERKIRDAKVVYSAPCGVLCSDIVDVHNYLTTTKCTNLFTENFCFSADISSDISMGKPSFEPLYTDNDLSNGLENVSISFISNIGPIIKYSFHYIVDMILDAKIHRTEQADQPCSCEEDCLQSCPCKSKDVLSECNSLCNCSFGCSNRVVQRGLKQCLQIVQEDTSFRVKALHDIPKDSFICSITGVVKHSLPEKGNFIYPLKTRQYEMEPESQNESETECKQSKVQSVEKCSTLDFYHDDAKLIMSSDLEFANRAFEKQLQKHSAINPHWVRTASRHSFMNALLEPSLSLTYPSLLPVRRDTSLRTKQRSSSSLSNNNLPEIKSETFLDCTEYGNIGRFIPIKEDFNAEVRPIVVDNASIPWLAVFSTSDILKDGFLVLKPFKR